MSEWIEISTPLRTGMAHWPGDLDVMISQVSRIPWGDVCNLTRLHMSAHTGTHMDAPLHFVDEGAAIDTMPVEAAVGIARVIQIEDGKVISRAEVSRHHPQPGERLLFRTSNSTRCWQTSEFVEDYVYIDPDCAVYLAESGVRTVGVDYLSVGGFHDGNVETHRALLGAGIWVIEGLRLDAVAPGTYELICLPLRIAGADGAPARAVLRRPRTLPGPFAGAM